MQSLGRILLDQQFVWFEVLTYVVVSVRPIIRALCCLYSAHTIRTEFNLSNRTEHRDLKTETGRSTGIKDGNRKEHRDSRRTQEGAPGFKTETERRSGIKNVRSEFKMKQEGAPGIKNREKRRD